MLNLDIRDLSFWAREAQKKHLRDRMAMTQAARVAFVGSNSDYSRYMTDLKHDLYILERGHDNVFKENWQALKDIGRG